MPLGGPERALILDRDDAARVLLREHLEPPREAGEHGSPGRPPTLPRTVVERIRLEYARGHSLAKIARALNDDDVPTAHGGQQWWPSTARAVLVRSSPLTSADVSKQAA